MPRRGMITSSTQACFVHEHHPPTTPLPGVLEDPVPWSWMPNALRGLWYRARSSSLWRRKFGSQDDLAFSREMFCCQVSIQQSVILTYVIGSDFSKKDKDMPRRSRRCNIEGGLGHGLGHSKDVRVLAPWVAEQRPACVAWMGLGGVIKVSAQDCPLHIASHHTAPE